METAPATIAATTPPTIAIELDQISVAANRRRRLDLTDEEDMRLIHGVERVGFLHPIQVRRAPDPKKPFEVVFGVRRLAVAKYLGHATIQARVVDATDAQVALARSIENTDRKHLKPAEYVAQVQKIHKAMEQIYGPDPGHALGGLARAASAARDARTGSFRENDRREAAADPRPEPASSPAELAGSEAPAPSQAEGDPAKTHAALISEITGRSKGSVSEDLLMSRSFDESDLTLLTASDVTRTDMLRIARLPEETRRLALAHVSAGERATRAIELAEAEAASPEPKPEPHPEHSLSDSDWLVSWCKPVREQLQDPTDFDRSALLYRRDRDMRAAHRGSIRDDLKRAFSPQGPPPLYASLMYNALWVEHPAHWYVCAVCGGRNVDRPECDHCRGRGYKLKFQERKAR